MIDAEPLQVSDLNERLSSSMMGRQSESEMCEEAVLKAARMENAMSELEARCEAMARENIDLKEHLNNALEHQVRYSICMAIWQLSVYTPSASKRSPIFISNTWTWSILGKFFESTSRPPSLSGASSLSSAPRRATRRSRLPFLSPPRTTTRTPRPPGSPPTLVTGN